MSTEKNKATLQRWVDALNKKDSNELDKLADEIFTPDFIERDPGISDMEPGPAGVKKWAHQVLKDSPDMHITIEDLLADGDKVISRSMVKFMDKDTGKPTTLLLLVIDRFVGEQIAEEWELGVIGHW